MIEFLISSINSVIYIMPFQLDSNHRLNCEVFDPIFQSDIKYLLDLSTEYLNKITDVDSINLNMLADLGDECYHLSMMKTDTSDLMDEESYSNIFTGQYSTHFIQIMLLIQLIWQLEWSTDTYAPFSEGRSYLGGVSPRDKEYFFQYLKDLHNKLLIIDHSIKKYESQH